MRCTVLVVSDFDSDDSVWEWSVCVWFARWQQVYGQWRVQRISQQHKLKLNLA